MVSQFAQCDCVVVASLAGVDQIQMIKDACRKRARCVAGTAIVQSRHMINGLAACRYPVAGSAVVYDSRMVYKRISKVGGVMTTAAVFAGRNMAGYSGAFAWCVDGIGVGVARIAGL